MADRKTALVTGAAGTMGRAVVEMFLRDGHRVALVDVNEKALSQLSSELPGETYASVFDISDPNAVESNMEKIAGEFGDIEILVNNAGILSNNKAMETKPEEWNRVLSINLSGAFYLSQAVLPTMRQKQWGRIINTTSYAAKSGGVTAGTAYSVSKAGVIMLTKVLAVEWAKHHINVNAIAPTYFETGILHPDPKIQAEMMYHIPMGRLGQPAELAGTVIYLASEASNFVTGHALLIDGGYTAW